MTTQTHTFTGRFTTDTRMSATCSCGAHLRHVTGDRKIAPSPVSPAIARRWFAAHTRKAAA